MTNPFTNKLIVPTAELLQEKLGKSTQCIDLIIEHIQQQYGTVQPEWKFYGGNSGWTLKLLLKKRNILFIAPREGYFTLAFALGKMAVDKLLCENLPESYSLQLRKERQYIEGQQLLIDIHSKSDLQYLWLVIKHKIIN